MAGLGLGPTDFALFEIDDPDERAAALEASLQPKLAAIWAASAVSGLVRVAGQGAPRPPRPARRAARGPPREEVLVAFCESDEGLPRPRLPRGGDDRAATSTPASACAASRRGAPAMQRAARARGREPRAQGEALPQAPPVPRTGTTRSCPSWRPAHSAAFWLELAADLAPGAPGLDVGIAWSARGGAQPRPRRSAGRLPRPVAALQGARERARSPRAAATPCPRRRGRPARRRPALRRRPAARRRRAPSRARPRRR